MRAYANRRHDAEYWDDKAKKDFGVSINLVPDSPAYLMNDLSPSNKYRWLHRASKVRLNDGIDAYLYAIDNVGGGFMDKPELYSFRAVLDNGAPLVKHENARDAAKYYFSTKKSI